MTSTSNLARPADLQSKLVLLGESTVGKSSLVLRFVRNEFPEFQECTIGAAFLTQVVNVGTYTVKLDIWDTAGQERYRSLAPMYYRGAAAAVIVYDITSPESFKRAKSWLQELRLAGEPNLVIVLVGNKCDLSAQRKVDTSEAQQYADSEDIIFMETSAKTGQNVNEVFVALAKKLPLKKSSGGGGADGSGGSSNRRTLNQPQSKKESKCC
eukprot:PhM_4_TR4209/c0_g1_i1/m.27612/K07887/RAB5A; Ras-related protein Rab-5A